MAPCTRSMTAKRDSRTGPRNKSPIVQSTRHTDTPSTVRHIQRPKRKRLQQYTETEGDIEDMHSFKQSQLSPPAHQLLKENLQIDPEAEANEEDIPPSKDQLSEANLQTLDRINPMTKNVRLKRSIPTTDTGTEGTQRSSNTAAAYRRKSLAAVKIHMHVKPPDYIQAAINHIVNAEVSEERRSELRVIAQEFRDSCLENVNHQAGEDDFIEPFRTALKSLGLKGLCIREKADWRVELKPSVPPQSLYSSSFVRQELDSAPPRKRQQKSVGYPYTSRNSSIANTPTLMPANCARKSNTIPALVPSIKNPRPDISMGIHLSTLSSALSLQDPDGVNTEDFLQWLQDEVVQQKSDGPLEPMLILVPAPRALKLAFPFAVVEGKAYSTGKQIFEAENQAAVSGACGLKIQLDLNDLVDRGATCTEPPLFFTFTTQGPIHELWAHWTVDEEGVRMFGSKLLDSSNALLLNQAEDVITRLENVSCWGLGPFMASVVERLGIVARKAKA